MIQLEQNVTPLFDHFIPNLSHILFKVLQSPTPCFRVTFVTF